MGRGPKPTKGKAKPAAPRTSRKNGAGVRDLEKRLAEAQEQQKATSEILRVISSSPTDVQPVFDAILQSALALCDTPFGVVLRLEGDEVLHLAAFKGPVRYAEIMRGGYPHPVTRDRLSGLAILERRAVHAVGLRSSEQFPHGRALANAAGFDATVFVPMLKEGRPIGAIGVGKTDAFSDDQIALLQTFADQAVIAIENVRLFNETKEALEQQTATADILRVISSSPTDVQPTFEAIAESATRLCGAVNGMVFRFDGELIHVAAHHNIGGAELDAVRSVFPIRPGRGSVAGRAIESRRIVHVEDLAQDPEYEQTRVVQAGFRTSLSVPMLRGGVPIGTINVMRMVVAPFSPSQIALLQTFADQAVIAIENVRLFNETKEALERQTATSEILRVISSSPTDAKPVFEAIARNAALLCDASRSAVSLLEGDWIRFVALYNFPEGWTQMHVADAPNATRVMRDGVIFHVADVETDARVTPEALSRTRALGARSFLMVPLHQETAPIGGIVVYRSEAGSFSEEQIELLKTFADQAVIAIENVRLFTELQGKNQALTEAHAQVTEALDQQTATADILRVISRSPTDVQPVFDTIVESAVTLCDGLFSALYQFDGEMLHHVAHHNFTPEALEVAHRVFPARPTRTLFAGRAILERAVVHIPDFELDPDYQHHALSRAVGQRSGLWVPMMREGAPIGVIGVARAEPGPFSDTQIALLETFADQAVIAIENVRLFTELQEKNSALTQAHAQVTEALKQQTATSEILKVISSSPTDVQPVFDSIVRSALRLCDAKFCVAYRYDGEQLQVVAHDNLTPEMLALLNARYPQPPSRETGTGVSTLERRVVHIQDANVDDVPPFSREFARQHGWGSMLAVPLLRDGEPVGNIVVSRVTRQPFTEQQIALVQTFADQAVIAIENVRLFNETKEALEQQTATGDILKVIASSPTDIQPVLDTVAESAARLCESTDAEIFRREGDWLLLVAHHGPIPSPASTLPAVRGAINGRAVLDGRTLHVVDLQSETDEFPLGRELARKNDTRAHLVVPLMREGVAIGSISLRRTEARLFTERQIALLQTFADQAVIAIENVRLFKELQEKNQALTVAHAQVTESLEQQTATAEILGVISSSPTDLGPVFESIARSAARLCGGVMGGVFRYDGELQHLGAMVNFGPAGEDTWRRIYPRPPSRDTATGRAILEGAVVIVPDVEADGRAEWAHEVARTGGYRSAMAVPMLREGSPTGAILVARAEPGSFPDGQIDLLRTFAGQAVIAVENARLFNELQTRTSDLTRSVGELTALGEVTRALSSTLDLETVLQTIVLRANELAGTAGCTIWEYDKARAEFRLRASHYADQGDAALLQAPGRVTTIPKGQGVTTRVMEQRQPVQIHDITNARDYESPIRQPLIEAGHRALLGVPLLSEDEVIGVLAVTRKTPGEFAPEIVQLLSTFATQSALAIQNARLFLEIEDKGRQLEAASQHKSEFLANMSHELRTPLNAIIGFSEVLTERMFGELNEKQEEYLKDIYASGQHLLSLINDILDLSKIEAGRMELELSDFHLPTALDSALTLVRERAGRRSIALHLSVDDRLGQIQADERKVRQVVLNLLSNAIKFTPEGGRIEIMAAPKDGVVEVSVSDTGVGIAPEDQEAVFEEFRQVGTADKKVEGTGLGLTLCRKFVELHGGRIWVMSQLGLGSTFTFTIPLTAKMPSA